MPSQPAGDIVQIAGAPGGVEIVEAAHDGGSGAAVVQRSAPFIVVNALEAHQHAHYSAHIAGVAVGIPAAHAADLQGL